MNRRYDRIIEHCIGCPSVTADINVTRWECHKKGGKMICWMGEEEDTHPIPDWCPLADESACPFCKGTDLATTSNGMDSYAIICDGCGAEGPTGVDEKDAENKWRNRKCLK